MTWRERKSVHVDLCRGGSQRGSCLLHGFQFRDPDQRTLLLALPHAGSCLCVIVRGGRGLQQYILELDDVTDGGGWVKVSGWGAEAGGEAHAPVTVQATMLYHLWCDATVSWLLSRARAEAWGVDDVADCTHRGRRQSGAARQPDYGSSSSSRP